MGGLNIRRQERGSPDQRQGHRQSHQRPDRWLPTPGVNESTSVHVAVYFSPSFGKSRSANSKAAF